MTRLLELLISVAIVAVLFLAVGLVLPSSRHLSHSVETNRRPTIVFDTLNNVRRMPAWHPVVLHDPKMQVRFEGPASGKGARLTYSSQEPGVGDGSWTIVESEQNKRVAYAIEDVHRGTNKRSEYVLRPTGRNNRNVQITQTYDVDYGMNLLGRYAGLYVSSSVGEEMKMGLSRLSNMLATVPNIDYSELSKDDPARAPKVIDRPAENLLIVTAAVDRDNAKVQAQMQANQEWIRKVMSANGLEAAGPVRIITNEFGAETYSFDVAQPVRKSGETGPATQYQGLKLEGPVEAVFNAPAKVATTTFKGHMANLSQVRDALRAWTMTNGYETAERPYESWNAGIPAGFTPEGEFTIYWGVK